MPTEIQERANISGQEFNPYQFFECGSRDRAKKRYGDAIRQKLGKDILGECPEKFWKILYTDLGFEIGNRLRRVYEGDDYLVSSNLITKSFWYLEIAADLPLGNLREPTPEIKHSLENRMKAVGFAAVGHAGEESDFYFFLLSEAIDNLGN